MERLDLGKLVAMRAPAFSYVRIDVNGFLTPPELLALLVDQRLGHFLATSGRQAALLNAAGMYRFGTEDVDFLAKKWAPLLASIAVRKLSLVVQDEVFMLFGQVFAAGAKDALASGVEVRCFPSEQFTNSWESVTWLDAPPGPPAPPPPGPAAGPPPAAAGGPALPEMPRLVESAVWQRADVAGIAFLTPADGPPGLGFLFRDAGAAMHIFSGWRRDLGACDTRDHLRVAIIEGDFPRQPPGYAVTIHPNMDALAALARTGGGLSFDVNALGSWGKRMNTAPGGSPHLQTFKQLFAQRGEYALVPVLLQGQDIEPRYDMQLVKRSLLLRNVRDIGPGDPDLPILG